MKYLATILASPVWALAGTLPSVVGGATHQPKALYFQDNNPEGTSVISLSISPGTGLLSKPVRISTGGKGLYALKNGSAPPTDTTFSQDSVFVSGNHLFVVNTGSSTVSYFQIPHDDPQHPVLVGKPGPVHGGFPNTVTYSPLHNIACAVATGAEAGVTCFDVTPTGLHPVGERIPLPPIRQTTPPNGPGDTASDIVFNPSQTGLFVTIKSNSTAHPGYIYVFPVKADGSLAKPVVSRPPELNHDFSLSFLDDSRAVISDITFGASIVDIGPDFKVTNKVKVTIPGQMASCWTVYAPEYNAIYVMDAGTPNITVLDPATGDIRYMLDGPSDGEGAYDAIRSGQFLYNLLGTAAIAVYDLSGSKGPSGRVPKLVQTLDLSSLGSRQGWQGLAVSQPKDLREQN